MPVLAALLTIFYVTNYKKSVQQGERTSFPSGSQPATSQWAMSLGAEVARPTPVPRSRGIAKRNVVLGAISQPDQIETLVATERIYGSRSHSTASGRLQQGGSRLNLAGLPAPSSWRAASTSFCWAPSRRVTTSTSSARSRSETVSPWTKVVLRDLLVLKAPNSGAVESKLGAKPDEGFSAILQLTDAQQLHHRPRRPGTPAPSRHRRG